MAKIRFDGIRDPKAPFEGLRGYRNALLALQQSCRPFQSDYRRRAPKGDGVAVRAGQLVDIVGSRPINADKEPLERHLSAAQLLEQVRC